jgi:hypothetical protein
VPFLLEGRQVQHAGEVGFQESVLLSAEAGPHGVQAGLAPLQLLGHPGAGLCTGKRLADQVRLLEHLAHVGPDERVELGGGRQARRAARLPSGRDSGELPATDVVLVLVRRAEPPPGAAEAAPPAPDEAPQEVVVAAVASRQVLVGSQALLHRCERLGRDQGRHGHGDPLLGRGGPGAHPATDGLQRRASVLRRAGA